MVRLITLLLAVYEHGYVSSHEANGPITIGDHPEIASCLEISNIVRKGFYLPQNSGTPSCILKIDQGDNITMQINCSDNITLSVPIANGVYPGKFILKCKAHFPMVLTYDGWHTNKCHRSIHVTHLARAIESGGLNYVESDIIAQFNIEPESSGRYTIRRPRNKSHSSSSFRPEVSFTILIFNRTKESKFTNSQSVKLYKKNKSQWNTPCVPFLDKSEAFSEKLKAISNFDWEIPKAKFVIDIFRKRLNIQAGDYGCLQEEDNSTINTLRDVKGDTIDLPDAIYNDFVITLNVSRIRSYCNLRDDRNEEYDMINLRTRNPSETRFKKDCLLNNHSCKGQVELNDNISLSYTSSCDTASFKKGGGILTCISKKSGRMDYFRDYFLGLDEKIYLGPFEDLNDNLPANSLMLAQVTEFGFAEEKIYTHTMYNISCICLSYLFLQPVKGWILFSNRTRKSFYSYAKFSDISSNLDDVSNHLASTELSFTQGGNISIGCSALWWNSRREYNVTLQLTVKHLTSVPCFTLPEESIAILHTSKLSWQYPHSPTSKKPEFSSTPTTFIVISGQSFELDCDYISDRKPNIAWKKDGKMLTDVIEKHLKISKANDESSGVYMCIVSIGILSAQKSFIVAVKEDSSGLSALYVMAIILILAIVFTTLVCSLVFKYYKKDTTGLSEIEILEFLNGIPENSRQLDPMNDDAVYFSLPYPKEYEISDKDFFLDETCILGSGAFGIVFKGNFRNEMVAIKTLKRNADLTYLRSLLRELKIMIYLNRHPQIVNLLGANTTHINRGSLFVVVELCPLGSMENYLRTHRHDYTDLFEKTDGNDSAIVCCDLKDNTFNTIDLIRWSYQISLGMEHLASKNVIHGDLAARNVLLQDKHTAKISDFGLSKRLYEYSNYMKQSKEPLPWRHMAIESLKDLKFSSKSDIWAFGITLSEIFSLGEVPYPGLSWNVEFVQKLDDGLRMKQTKYTNDFMYDIQTRCCFKDENLRPTFEIVRCQMHEALQSLKSKYPGEEFSWNEWQL